MVPEEIVPKIKQLITNWGGKLHVETQTGPFVYSGSRLSTHRTIKSDLFGEYAERNPLWSDNPFSDLYAICWSTKEIAMRMPMTNLELCGLFHEIGHVFACPTDPVKGECEEINFFAWEWLLAKQFGMANAWRTENKSYGISGTFKEFPASDFGDLSANKQLEFLTKLLEETKILNPKLFDGDCPLLIR